MLKNHSVLVLSETVLVLLIESTGGTLMTPSPKTLNLEFEAGMVKSVAEGNTVV
jgi:hypothetical protein